MTRIKPFRAVRPTRDKVSLVASRSYQTYTKKEIEGRLDYNPFSFLHIINPGYKYEHKITGKERYEMVRNRYLEFKENQVFIQDESPCFYVYKIVNREGHEFSGIIAAASTADYEAGIIKRHEDTIAYREHIFKEYLKITQFNAEPVLLTYPDNRVISEIIKETQKARAEFEFTTTYRDTHYLWILSDVKHIDRIEKAFASIPTVYVADGHHRLASSHLLAKEMALEGAKDAYNYFMSYLIPESELRIFEFNRLVTDLNGLSKEAFLIQLDANFRIENRGKNLYRPSKKHHFSMYLDGCFYSLYLRSSYAMKTALDALDTQILYTTVLKPILGITDLRNDTRIAYSQGKNNLVTVKAKVDSGAFAVGFGLVPVSIFELKAIADAGETMPPKSTCITPKLRSGVTIYEF
ncbi:DUF1015 domain-containing protein [Aestuariivivens sediminicola]|uniref:DUF1015 domain-containing protein n=1 Tax=Aestuariivivens sediminicola TaxID=2913560 RepID=UPI001F5784CF|nr:DUF1015 domain-containing protein [Aestuariivivens sediminicola]